MRRKSPRPKSNDPPKEKKRGNPKALEDTLARWLDAMIPFGLPAYEREYHFAKPQRQFRADFAFPSHWVIIEVDGGTYGGGKHATGAGIDRDHEKQNLAHLLGWTVYRVSAKTLARHGTTEPYALHLVRRIFNLANITDADLSTLATRRVRRGACAPGGQDLPPVRPKRRRTPPSPPGPDPR